jgi:hypothetical protein
LFFETDVVDAKDSGIFGKEEETKKGLDVVVVVVRGVVSMVCCDVVVAKESNDDGE